jgi:hypothetical protein
MEQQKAFDHVKWTKLKQVLNEDGSNCSQRRWISKLYMDQSVKSIMETREDKKCEDRKRN